MTLSCPTPPHPTPVQPVDTTPETFYVRKNGDIKFDTPSQGAVSTACLKEPSFLGAISPSPGLSGARVSTAPVALRRLRAAAGGVAVEKCAEPRGRERRETEGYLKIVMWGFHKWGYPQIIQFNGMFHYKPTILGVPPFMETSICEYLTIESYYHYYIVMDWILSHHHCYRW